MKSRDAHRGKAKGEAEIRQEPERAQRGVVQRSPKDSQSLAFESAQSLRRCLPLLLSSSSPTSSTLTFTTTSPFLLSYSTPNTTLHNLSITHKHLSRPAMAAAANAQ